MTYKTAKILFGTSRAVDIIRNVYHVALWHRKKPIFAVFWTSAFSDVDSWRQSKLNADAQLQTD